MGTRLELQGVLIALLGSSNVYFQPPNTIQMEYPCIVYKLDHVQTLFSDNSPYSRHKRYLITYIDRSTSSDVPDKIGMLPLSIFDRNFTADNLHHDVFKLFF